MSELSNPTAPTKEHTSVLRMYTQHNVFFGMFVSPLAALVVYWATRSADSTCDLGVECLLSADGVLLLIALMGPMMGALFLNKHGPLVIDPGAETLTYKRHVFSFGELGLVRIGSMQSDHDPQERTLA